ncbi:MAG: hypothetical protein AMJ95_01395 [Omnitrophica WOR_2 bacterium SM23_72]|nr:MAG: hypothetical protein AMJ95_01395 [Omnitrophica WOR_2 bacterium SM23_72]
MQTFNITLYQQVDTRDLKLFISNLDFNDYKYYRVFKKKIVCEYIFNQISGLSTDSKKNWIIIARCKDKIVGLVSLVKLVWAREIFGIEMAEMKHIIIPEEHKNNKDVIKNLLSFVSRICSQERVSCLYCRVSTDNYSVFHSLEEEGFKIMDTLVTYLFNKRKHKISPFKSMCQVRLFRDDDMRSLVKMVQGIFILSHFYKDSNISRKNADKFYIRWIQECCRGSLADKVLVAERNNKILGFLTYKINKEFYKMTGYKIVGQGLAAVSERGLGIFPALVKSYIQDIVRWYDFGEIDTQINNYEVIRTCQRFGLDFVRSKFTFHKWFNKTTR